MPRGGPLLPMGQPGWEAKVGKEGAAEGRFADSRRVQWSCLAFPPLCSEAVAPFGGIRPVRISKVIPRFDPRGSPLTVAGPWPILTAFPFTSRWSRDAPGLLIRAPSLCHEISFVKAARSVNNSREYEGLEAPLHLRCHHSRSFDSYWSRR